MILIFAPEVSILWKVAGYFKLKCKMNEFALIAPKLVI